MRAPHLPRQSASEMAQFWNFLAWLILVVVLSVLTSVVVTLITVGWFAPVAGNGIFFQISRQAKENQSPDAALLAQTKQRLVRVYLKKQKIDGQFYPPTAILGEAALLSVDGWAVMYRSAYRPGEEAQWEGVDYRGGVVQIAASAYDPLGKFLYLRFQGESFRLFTLASREDLSAAERLFVLRHGDWRGSAIADVSAAENTAPHPIWQPQPQYRFVADAAGGEPVVNGRGELAGFVDDGGRLVPVWLVDLQLAAVLSRGRVAYRGVPWEGYPVQGVAVSTTRHDGFYVTKTPSGDKSAGVQKNDLITAVNYQAARGLDLAYFILAAPEKFTVSVLRAGRELEIGVVKVPLVPEALDKQGKE